MRPVVVSQGNARAAAVSPCGNREAAPRIIAAGRWRTTRTRQRRSALPVAGFTGDQMQAEGHEHERGEKQKQLGPGRIYGAGQQYEERGDPTNSADNCRAVLGKESCV